MCGASGRPEGEWHLLNSYLKRSITIVVFVLLSTLVFAADQASKSKQDLFWQKMTDRVDQIMLKHDGVMGVSIIDLTDQRTFNRNAGQTFTTASSIKLCLLLELYRQEQRGRGGEKNVARLQD